MRRTTSASALALLFVLASVANAADFDAKIVDKRWDGVKVPEGQQCSRFGGNKPYSPRMAVSGIPEGANLLVLEFSDRDNKAMDKGGHGIIGMAIPNHGGKSSVAPIQGNTFLLPPGYVTLSPHRGSGQDKAGAYMPPCSGGKGHAYYVKVKAVRMQEGGKQETLAEKVVEMGRY